MSTEYKNINADTMYDVLHDPEYRKVNVNKGKCKHPARYTE